MQMMSWSWGWRPDRDHRIQPGYPQWCSVKVKSPYLSSCSSVFVAAREKKIIELISILILPEVALYRSLDSQDQIRFCFPVYLKPSQKGFCDLSGPRLDCSLTSQPSHWAAWMAVLPTRIKLLFLFCLLLTNLCLLAFADGDKSRILGFVD